MYLVSYSEGAWDNHHVINLFVTESEETALKYQEKFNTMLYKWKGYYNSLRWGKDWELRLNNPDFEIRYRAIMETGKCRVNKIKDSE